MKVNLLLICILIEEFYFHDYRPIGISDTFTTPPLYMPPVACDWDAVSLTLSTAVVSFPSRLPPVVPTSV